MSDAEPELPIVIKRDGKEVSRVADSNAAFEWLLKHQPMSIDWAILHEGYSVHGPDGKELEEYKK